MKICSGLAFCRGVLYDCSVLEYLRIRGLAIAHDVQLELGAGLNVLSGETGAGKSIVVDALSLLRGARGRAALVRDGADALVVEGQFAVAVVLQEGENLIEVVVRDGFGGERRTQHLVERDTQAPQATRADVVWGP